MKEEEERETGELFQRTWWSHVVATETIFLVDFSQNISEVNFFPTNLQKQEIFKILNY
jgi:hypothetical protein